MAKGKLLRTSDRIVATALLGAGWSTRKVANVTGLSKSTTHRVGQDEANGKKLLSQAERVAVREGLSDSLLGKMVDIEGGINTTDIKEAPLRDKTRALRDLANTHELIRPKESSGSMMYVEERYGISPTGENIKATLTIQSKADAPACTPEVVNPTESTPCDKS